jgi:hypothetical protein
LEKLSSCKPGYRSLCLRCISITSNKSPFRFPICLSFRFSSRRDGIQSMYEQPYTINKLARTATALACCFAKLGEQLAERGEFHPPVPFFKFIPEVARFLESCDMNADYGGTGTGTWCSRPRLRDATIHGGARTRGPPLRITTEKWVKMCHLTKKCARTD